MALAAIADRLASSAEFSESFDEIVALDEAARTGRGHELRLSSGRIRAADLRARSARIEYTPLEIGKPLRVRLLAVYTGDAPRKIGLGKPALLVTSAVAAAETRGVEALPRAINQIRDGITDKEYFEPNPLEKGYPILYYTPALLDSDVMMAVELAADTFNPEVFGHLSKLTGTLAGIPAFAAAKALLTLGSSAATVLEPLARAIEGGAYMSDSLTLYFSTAEFQRAAAGFYVFCNRRDEPEFARCQVDVKGSPTGDQHAVLAGRESGKPYNGDAPYVIVSVDGRKIPDLASFGPNLASAAILETFYGRSISGSEVVEALGSAMELYNDYSFYTKAVTIKKQIAELKPDSQTFEKDKEELAARLEAYKANIQREVFRDQV